jgi:hypothetical protein
VVAFSSDVKEKLERKIGKVRSCEGKERGRRGEGKKKGRKVTSKELTTQKRKESLFFTLEVDKG